MEAMAGVRVMAKKAKQVQPRKHGGVLRVSDEFAKAVADAARMARMSAGEFNARFAVLMPTVASGITEGHRSSRPSEAD